MKTVLAAAAAVLALAAAPAFAQTSDAATGAVNPMPAPSADTNTGANAPTTVNPAPSDAAPPPAAGSTGESATSTPIADTSAATNSELRHNYPVCMKVHQDSCRVTHTTPPAAR